MRIPRVTNPRCPSGVRTANSASSSPWLSVTVMATQASTMGCECSVECALSVGHPASSRSVQLHQVAGWAGEIAAVSSHGLLADGAAGLVGHRCPFGCHGGPRGVEPLIRRVCPACLIIPAALFCCPPRRAFIARWLARFTGPYVRCRMPTVSLLRLPELAVSWCPRGRSRATSTATPRSPAAAVAVAVSAGSYEGPQIRGWLSHVEVARRLPEGCPDDIDMAGYLGGHLE